MRFQGRECTCGRMERNILGRGSATKCMDKDISFGPKIKSILAHFLKINGVVLADSDGLMEENTREGGRRVSNME